MKLPPMATGWRVIAKADEFFLRDSLLFCKTAEIEVAGQWVPLNSFRIQGEEITVPSGFDGVPVIATFHPDAAVYAAPDSVEYQCALCFQIHDEGSVLWQLRMRAGRPQPGAKA